MKALIVVGLFFISASAFADFAHYVDEKSYDQANLCSVQACQKSDRGYSFRQTCQFYQNIPIPGDPNVYEVAQMIPGCVCPCTEDYLGYQAPLPGQ